ncbi:MAG: hypothetical protein ABIR79_13810 [Candidatus Binatia bacterium]
MTMATMMTWMGPALDVAAVMLLGAVLWRLGRDPGAGWDEREARLQTIFDDLRTLVAQSEGLARELDGKLAGREERLRTLLTEAKAATETAPPPARRTKVETRDEVAAPAALDPVAMAARIEALADGGSSADEIARQLGVAAAEVRLVIGLKAARAARRRASALEMRAHA